MANGKGPSGGADAALARSVRAAQGVGISDDQRQIILNAAGGDVRKAATMENILRIENRGKPAPDNDALSPVGAYGAWQFVPATWGQFGEGDIRKAGDFATGAHATSKFIDWIARKYGTDDPAVIAAYYNGGGRAAYAVAHGGEPPAAETQDYVRMMRGLAPPVPVPRPAQPGDPAP